MVLVTGGSGLVGAHLLLHLVENGENVRAIYRNLDSIQKTKSLFLLYKKEVLFEKMYNQIKARLDKEKTKVNSLIKVEAKKLILKAKKQKKLKQKKEADSIKKAKLKTDKETDSIKKRLFEEKKRRVQIKN